MEIGPRISETHWHIFALMENHTVRVETKAVGPTDTAESLCCILDESLDVVGIAPDDQGRVYLCEAPDDHHTSRFYAKQYITACRLAHHMGKVTKQEALVIPQNLFAEFRRIATPP